MNTKLRIDEKTREAIRVDLDSNKPKLQIAREYGVSSVWVHYFAKGEKCPYNVVGKKKRESWPKKPPQKQIRHKYTCPITGFKY